MNEGRVNLCVKRSQMHTNAAPRQTSASAITCTSYSLGTYTSAAAGIVQESLIIEANLLSVLCLETLRHRPLDRPSSTTLHHGSHQTAGAAVPEGAVPEGIVPFPPSPPPPPTNPLSAFACPPSACK